MDAVVWLKKISENREREREKKNSSTYLPLIGCIKAYDDVDREKM